MVRIEDPPPRRKAKPILIELPEKSQLLRIYSPEPYGTKPCSFRRKGGAKGRFDHHLDGIEDISRGVHYSAQTLAGCLVECFDPNAGVSLEGRRLAFIRTTRPLKLLELRGSGAMKAGTVAALCKTEDRKRTQKWSRYFYETYSSIDGLVYSNAHNDATAYALYERAEGALDCKQDWPLAAPELRSRILAACEENNLDLVR